MKSITKIDDLVSGSVYWVRLKDNDRAAVESVVCAINRSRHYFVFSNDIDVNKDISHHDAHTILNNHIVVGPVPTPTIWEFMKHTVEMKADSSPNLCMEVTLPSGQQCNLRSPPEEWAPHGKSLLEEARKVPPIQKLDPKYTTGQVISEHNGGVLVETVDVVPYVLNEKEQIEININMILLCLFRLDARMIIGRQTCGYTIVMSQPTGKSHKFYIHVLRTMGESTIHTKTVNEIAKHIETRTPECKAFDWADASSMFTMLLKMTPGHETNNGDQ